MEFVYIKHINLVLTTSELKKIDKEKLWFLKLQPTTKKGLFTPTNNKKFYKIAHIDILLTYMVYKKRIKACCSLSLYIFCGISIISDELSIGQLQRTVLHDTWVFFVYSLIISYAKLLFELGIMIKLIHYLVA